ncbi:uncharacterized protein LOC119992678 [Tripterygium wilfordii]|uniref:uncharacterized protein LOC119992678 n=1 Tax=Tripterygium wilfordii TaxID=458696 RepID=UPI0018F7F4F4|nr:uncharacterized protein LOC119992678 [Tripterygium wilfordii]
MFVIHLYVSACERICVEFKGIIYPNSHLISLKDAEMETGKSCNHSIRVLERKGKNACSYCRSIQKADDFSFKIAESAIDRTTNKPIHPTEPFLSAGRHHVRNQAISGESHSPLPIENSDDYIGQGRRNPGPAHEYKVIVSVQDAEAVMKREEGTYLQLMGICVEEALHSALAYLLGYNCNDEEELEAALRICRSKSSIWSFHHLVIHLDIWSQCFFLPHTFCDFAV